MVNSITFVLLAWFALPVLSCKCRVVTPVTGFCQADYGIRAKVLKDRQLISYNITTQHGSFDVGMFYYEVNVILVFRGNDKLENVTRVQTFQNSTWNTYIYTQRSSASCGVTLSVGDEYLLTGYVRDGRPSISSCGLIRLFKSDDIREVVDKGSSVCLQRIVYTGGNSDSAATGVYLSPNMFLSVTIGYLLLMS